MVFNYQCPVQVAVPSLLSKHNIIVFPNFCFVSVAELSWHSTCLLYDFCLPKLQPLSISLFLLFCGPQTKTCSVLLSAGQCYKFQLLLVTIVSTVSKSSKFFKGKEDSKLLPCS